MILDDQATSRQLVRKVLENALDDAHIVDFAEGAEALEWLADSAVDLVLSDYSMPTMDGITFTRRFRRQPQHRDVPLVFVTISDEQEIRLEALNAGATDFLNKPLDHLELRARCINLLRLRRYQINLRERAASLEASLQTTRAMIDERERDTVHTVAAVMQWSAISTPSRQRRVAAVCEAVARRLGYEPGDAKALGIAATLHDVGKVAVPDFLLDQPEPFSEQELNLVRRQSQAGYEMLRGSLSRYARRAADIAHHLYERYDGTGFPGDLAGEDIPADARIVSLVAVIEARLSHRADRPAQSLDELFEWLGTRAGGLFDPKCVEAIRAEEERIRDLYAGPR